MLGSLTSQQLGFFAILLAAFALLITERLRYDLVGLLIVLALYLSGILEPAEATSGFSSEPAIIVAAIFVLSAAVQQTGLSDRIGRWIMGLAGDNLNRVLLVMMPSVAVFSAFTHHLTTTAMMLPVMLNLSRQHRIPASKLLMPLSIAASLGTTITIIGAPAFIIASSALQQAGRPALGIFAIAPIGLTLSVLGTLYMVLAGQRLLPSREGVEGSSTRFRLDDYFTELIVLPDSPLAGMTIEQIEADQRYHFRVAGWLRDRRHISPPFGKRQVQAGDVLLVRTTPEAMVAERGTSGVELHPVVQYGESRTGKEEFAEMLVQAVVAPRSDLAGRTIGRIDFKRRYGAIVVGLWRQGGWLREEISRITLRTGDVLVLQGDEASLNRVAADPAFLMLVPFQGEVHSPGKAGLAGAIMVAAVLVAASGLMTIEMAMVAGAVAMVLSGCIRMRQAYRAIDARIFVFIAGVIPLGLAMEKTGAAAVLAGGLQRVVESWQPAFILLALFAIVAVVTQFMSDAATTAIFAPVAVALAQALRQPPEPFVVTVAMAAVAAFLTPIGHHANLLVYEPGRYRFTDFTIVGLPLTVLVALVVTFLAYSLWGGTG